MKFCSQCEYVQAWNTLKDHLKELKKYHGEKMKFSSEENSDNDIGEKINSLCVYNFVEKLLEQMEGFQQNEV